MMDDTYEELHPTDVDAHYNYPINTSSQQTHPRFVAPAFQGRSTMAVGSSDSPSPVVSESAMDNDISGAIRARIATHPLYPKLLQAYIDCQKVGAPPEIADLLEDMRENDVSTAASSWLGADPELDDFMEAYCDVLVRYKWDLSRPFNEATSFLNNIQTQLNNLCCNCVTHLSDEAMGGSSDEEMNESYIHGMEDEHQDLKNKLLRKYSGYISTLKLEFSKKKKKGKLPKDARQTLLDWWNAHYKWPYPTEVDKAVLAEMTGLDPKQINNWFINQRKRHWKPSEKMQLGVMESVYAPFLNN